jgi:hypothetical protein
VAGDLEQGPDRARGDPWGGTGSRGRRPLGREPGEHRVRGVLGDPQPAAERQVPEVEVARAPAEHRRVQGDDDRVAPAALRAVQEAVDEVVRGRPVELEPARRRASGRGDRLQWRPGLVAHDHRHPRRGGPAGDREVGVAAHQVERADRGQQQRRRETSAEEVDGEVALGRAAQHPRHDLVAGVRRPVGAHRRLGAGPAADVGVGGAAHRPPTAAFPFRRGRGDAGAAAGDAVAVDLLLAGASRPGRHGRIV